MPLALKGLELGRIYQDSMASLKYAGSFGNILKTKNHHRFLWRETGKGIHVVHIDISFT